MRIHLELQKSIDQNAGLYFEQAKKAKAKAEGARTALEDTKRKLKSAQKDLAKEQAASHAAQQEQQRASDHKEQAKARAAWYHSYRWFLSSDGILCVGGRDATQNEVLIKKHTQPGDKVLHTDMAGSPFFIVKAEGNDIPESTLQEAANATASFSKAWGLGLSSTPVFWVKPEQVSKEAASGEYLTRGAFVIKGKTNYLDNQMDLCIGVVDRFVMAGPERAVASHSPTYVRILPGGQKTSAVAKATYNIILKGEPKSYLDDIIRALPTGGCSLPKRLEHTGKQRQ
ncbi:hypothetical protein COV94_06960 [Candidatus Woesearchaeota archaeon CG11_big_fil_rev_8_21_14_0_20_57_5]|nr:MAG: hypothetical protein COV94_06960 [Candidatus Woesearchaeota archaeon CG11_big_fil_rev_8_21_14_0_20_57_5]